MKAFVLIVGQDTTQRRAILSNFGFTQICSKLYLATGLITRNSVEYISIIK